MSSKFLLFRQFDTKTHAFAHIHPQSVTTLLLASGNYRPRHSTLPLGITWLKHTTCVLLFVSMYSPPWSATKYKAVRVHSQILQVSAIVTCPDSYVTFHKCCGHWWHDSRRHPKCYLGRLGALHLSDVQQILRTVGYVWAHSLNFRVANDLGQLVPPWGYQTLQTNRIGVVHVRVQGSLDSKLLSTKKISTEKSLANRSEHICREAALFDTNRDVLEQELSLPMPTMLFSCI